MKKEINSHNDNKKPWHDYSGRHGQLNMQTSHVREFVNSHDIGGFTNVSDLLKFIDGDNLDDFMLLRGIRSKSEVKGMSLDDKVNTLVIEKCSRSLTKGQESECVNESLEMSPDELLKSYDHYFDVERYKGFPIIRRVEHKNKIDECNTSIMKLFIQKVGLQENTQASQGGIPE